MIHSRRRELSEQLQAAERELRAAQGALARDEAGARTRYARAREVLAVLEHALEIELLLRSSDKSADSTEC